MNIKHDNIMNLRLILKDFVDSKPDIIVLGCTHFPLLRAELETILPESQWIDSGDAIAKRVLHFGIAPSEKSVIASSAFFTEDNLMAADLKTYGLDSLKILPF